MPRIEMNDLMQAYSQMTPESINLIKWFYTSFDNRAAANQRIINVEPLFFQGAIAASEFLVYAATKLYIALAIEASNGSGIPNNNFGLVTFHNEGNVAFYYMFNESINFNGVAAADRSVNMNAKQSNCYFSRITVANYATMIFNGFRITLV